MDPTAKAVAKAVVEAERDPLGRVPVGYEVDRSDPDVLVLRRSDGSFMTAFRRGGKERRRERGRRGRAEERGGVRPGAPDDGRRRGDEPQTRPA